MNQRKIWNKLLTNKTFHKFAKKDKLTKEEIIKMENFIKKNLFA
jgi:hypothetical protein